MIPTDRRSIDEALDEIRFLLHQIAARLDQCRVCVEAMIGQQEHHRLEAALALDRKGLGRHVALHRGVLVGKERLRIERVGLHFRFVEAEVGLEPLEIGRHALFRHEQRPCLQIFELRDAGMRDEHLRIFLEACGHRDGRNVLRNGIERLQRIGAHEEIEFPDREQDRLFTFGPPGTMVTSRPYLFMCRRRAPDRNRRARPPPPSWCRSEPCRAPATASKRSPRRRQFRQSRRILMARLLST